MSTGRSKNRFLAGVLAIVLLTLPVFPAFADDGVVPPVAPTIVAGVVVGGVDVSGLTGPEAEATLTANPTTLTLGPLYADANGTRFKLDPVTAVRFDATGLVAEALTATGPAEIAPRWTIVDAVVAKFAARIADAIDRKAISTKRKIVKRRLKLTTSRVGLTVNEANTVSVVRAALQAELAAGGLAQPTVRVPIKVTKPKTTSANIGKAVLVVLRERRVYVYKNAKVEKTYRCAIGMARYPTPTGTFKVVRKAKNPTWYNPGSGWGSGMPSFIGPGANNPLGLRALYLNVSGIRIHGTSKTSSIGRAASHGCIRLKNKDVVNIYPRVNVGVPVYIVK